MYDQLSGHAIFRHDDCLKLNIRSSYTGSLTDELERLFVPSGASSSGVGSRNPQVSVWADFSTNGVDSELDEIDQLGIRVRRGDSAAASGGESMSDSCSTASSSPELETGGFPLVGGQQQQHGVGSDLAAPMSRTRLLEILRMSERGRLKSKAAAQKAAAAKLAQPTSNPTQVCVFCRNNGENEMVYSSHTLKDAYGKTACPVLYIYTCPICRANGPEAHTIKYCPQNNHSGVQAAAVAIAPQPQAPKPTRATFSRHQRRQQRYQQQQQKQLQQMQSFTSSNWGN